MIRPAAGFTLIELLAVLAVIGLAGAAVMLTLPSGRDGLDRNADALATGLARARDEAILGTRAVAVTATAQGYGFTRQRFGGWQPLDERPFGNALWADGVVPQLPPGREQVSFRFDPAGGAEAGSVVLAGDGRALRVAVDTTGQVRIDDAAR